MSVIQDQVSAQQAQAQAFRASQANQAVHRPPKETNQDSVTAESLKSFKKMTDRPNQKNPEVSVLEPDPNLSFLHQDVLFFEKSDGAVSAAEKMHLFEKQNMKSSFSICYTNSKKFIISEIN